MYEQKILGLHDAQAAIDAVLAAAGDGGAPIAVAVTDPNGDLIAFACMDGAGHLPRDMAVRKAYTSARMGADSGVFGPRIASMGVSVTDLDQRLSGFAGGVCVRVDGRVAGAIGVSGRSEEDDDALARTGAAALAPGRG